MRHNKVKVACLIGPSQHHYSSIASLLKSGVDIRGVVVGDSKKHGINFKFLKNAIKKQGLFKIIGQIFERIIYKILNSKKDKKIYNLLFNKNDKDYVNQYLNDNVLYVESYSENCVEEFIKKRNVDVLFIHTQFWVPKKIRALVFNRVIGSHPGITQYYRGVHSSFWAIYNNDVKNIGFTIFWVNNTVDGGDIIFQDNITADDNDSYITLSWKGMKMVSEKIPFILNNIESISDIKSIPYGECLPETLYYHPTLINYIKYRIKSKYR